MGSPLIGCRAVFGSASPGFPEPEPGVGGTDKVSTVVAQRRPSCEETICCASALQAARTRSPNQSRPRGMMSSHCVLYVSQLPDTHAPLAGRMRQQRPAESAGCKTQAVRSSALQMSTLTSMHKRMKWNAHSREHLRRNFCHMSPFS